MQCSVLFWDFLCTVQHSVGAWDHSDLIPRLVEFICTLSLLIFHPLRRNIRSFLLIHSILCCFLLIVHYNARFKLSPESRLDSLLLSKTQVQSLDYIVDSPQSSLPHGSSRQPDSLVVTYLVSSGGAMVLSRLPTAESALLPSSVRLGWGSHSSLVQWSPSSSGGPVGY